MGSVLSCGTEVAAKEKSGIRFLPVRIIFNGLKRSLYKTSATIWCFQSTGEFQGSLPTLSLWPAVPETPAERDSVKTEELTSPSLAGGLLSACLQNAIDLTDARLERHGSSGAPGELSSAAACPPHSGRQEGAGRRPGAPRGWLCSPRSKGRFPPPPSGHTLEVSPLASGSALRTRLSCF